MSRSNLKKLDCDSGNSSFDSSKDHIYKEEWANENRTKFFNTQILSKPNYDEHSFDGSTSPPSPLDESYESSNLSDLSPRSSSSGDCLHCGEFGHVLRDCYLISLNIKSSSSQVPFSGRCFKCNTFGHKSKDCLVPGMTLSQSFVCAYFKYIDGDWDEYLDQIKESNLKARYEEEDWDKEANLVSSSFTPEELQFEDVEDDLNEEIKSIMGSKYPDISEVKKEMKKFYLEKNQYFNIISAHFFKKRQNEAATFEKLRRRNKRDSKLTGLNKDNIEQFTDETS